MRSNQGPVDSGPYFQVKHRTLLKRDYLAGKLTKFTF
jgi:hypothetical protein